MKRVTELIKQNIPWIIIGMLILAFVAIAIQSNDETEELDTAFVNADRASGMYKGDQDAPVNIVVYTDFLCPYCSNFANDVMPLIDKEYIETGKAQVEVRPVAMIGLDSDIAAEAAYCAADQDQFWPFHDELYKYVEREIIDSGINTREESVLPEPTLTKLLESRTDFDVSAFRSCLSDGAHVDTVKTATSDAMANGVSGTPYVMINGNHIQGPTYEIMSSVIKAQL